MNMSLSNKTEVAQDSRFAQIKEELLQRLQRCIPQSEQIVLCGRLLLEVKQEGYYRLDQYPGIDEWAEGLFQLKARQTGKYITVAKMFTPEDFAGKTIGIEKLYQLAQKKARTTDQDLTQDIDSLERRQTRGPLAVVARALSTQATKLERLLDSEESFSQEEIAQTLAALEHLTSIKERLHSQADPAEPEELPTKVEDHPRPSSGPDPILTKEEIGQLYNEVIAPLLAQSKEDKAPLLENLSRIARGHRTEQRFAEVQAQILQVAEQIPKRGRKKWERQAEALLANLRATFPQAAVFAKRLAQVLSHC